jgi:hypothetical protein
MLLLRRRRGIPLPDRRRVPGDLSQPVAVVAMDRLVYK